MGISYSSWLRVGYSFSDQEILNTFKHVTAPAKTITEDRYSSKTGKKLKPAIKQIPEQWEIRIHGQLVKEEYDYWGELIAPRVGCEFDSYGSFCEGETFTAFYLPTKTLKSELDEYKCSVGGSLDYADVHSKQVELVRLKTKLESLGLKPRAPEVISCWTCG